ncbi:MAG: Putative lipoprotein [Parcubacteria bacterium 33_209]|nr:MAG: Putative lipoprotein [Parcubacteria bacterium 33_209]
MKTFSKINKPLILGSFVIFALLFLGLAQVYSQSACSNQLSGLNRFSSCQVNVGDTLVVNAEGCTNTCYKIVNSTANNLFVPTNTCAEWDAFLAHLPTGVATDTCITAPTISVSNTTKAFGDAPFTIAHSTNSAGAKTFSSSNTSVATITNDGLVTIVGGGTTTITFNTAATEDHYAGTATATLTVNKANQTAPSAPTCSSVTISSVTISSCPGCEYRRGAGSAQSSATFSGLSSSTSYTFSRRYASTDNYNASDWSSNRTCTTSAPPPDACNNARSATIQGAIYPIVAIGNQCWMAKNLNIVTGSSWCYDNNSSNCATYGRLYTWYAATSVCGSGWHLPSKAEYNTMLSITGYYIGDLNLAGWSVGSPGGYRFSSGRFYGMGVENKWWDETVRDAYGQMADYWRTDTSWTTRFMNGGGDMGSGLSVRCLKN